MITQEEAALYDRQIRLWGLTAQSRIRASRVLMVGFSGLASEVAKTLVLAGVDSITIIDNEREPNENDLTSNIFCRPLDSHEVNGGISFRTDQVVAKLNRMNPMVRVNIDNSDVMEKSSDYFREFNLVTLHQMMGKDEIDKINVLCRDNNVKFYIAFDFGMFGVAFSDLGDSYTFTVDGETKSLLKLKSQSTSTEPITTEENCHKEEEEDEMTRRVKRPRLAPIETLTEIDNDNESVNEHKISFVSIGQVLSARCDKSGNTGINQKTNPSFVILHIMMEFHSRFKRYPQLTSYKQDMIELDEFKEKVLCKLRLTDAVFNDVPDWRENVFGSLSSVCSVVGGVIGQDMIRTLSGKEAPICNLFLFDGLTMTGVIEKIGLNNNNDVKNQQNLEVYEEIIL